MFEGMNHRYLERIRGNSCYPTFRIVVQIATYLAYLAAGCLVIVGLITGKVSTILLMIVAAAVVAIVARVAQEVTLMVADIADAAIDSAAAQDERKP